MQKSRHLKREKRNVQIGHNEKDMTCGNSDNGKGENRWKEWRKYLERKYSNKKKNKLDSQIIFKLLLWAFPLKLRYLIIQSFP